MYKFEFAKYTEITELCFTNNISYKSEGYVRFFICQDVWDFWFVRILQGFNEEYEKDDVSYILERNKIPMKYKGEKLTISKVINIINDDDYSNWDINQSYNLDVLIGIIDNGYGINNLQK